MIKFADFCWPGFMVILAKCLEYLKFLHDPLLENHSIFLARVSEISHCCYFYGLYFYTNAGLGTLAYNGVFLLCAFKIEHFD